MSIDSEAPERKHIALRILLAVIATPIALFALNVGDFFQDFLVDFLTGNGFADDTFMYVWPYISRDVAAVFSNDLLAEYLQTAQAPQGYDMFMAFVGKHVDIRIAAIAIGVFLYAIVFLFALRTAYLMAGMPGAVCTAFILLGSVYLLNFMNGALPRSFGPPLIAMTLYGLVSGRLFYVIVSTILGTLFYYMAGIVAGLSLLIYCLLPPGWRPATADLSLGRRLTMLAITGAVSLVILGSSVTRDHNFGAVVDPANYDAFPEAGPEGRYWFQWNGVVADMADIAMSTFDTWARQGAEGSNPLRAFYFSMDRWADALRTELGLALLVALGIVVALSPRRDTAGVLTVVFASSLLYVAAVAAFPLLFFPTRFFQAVIPVVIALMVAWAGRRLFVMLRPSVSDVTQAAVLVLAVSLVLIATGRPQWARLVTFSEADRAVFAFIRDLPEDALIAGWPRDRVIDAVPYLGERSVLLSYETHQGFREDFILLTRERMQTVIQALVVGDADAVRVLRDRFDVTHVVINRDILPGQDLSYFEPFQTTLDAIEDRGGVELLRSGAAGPIVYDRDPFFIVELDPVSGRAR